MKKYLITAFFSLTAGCMLAANGNEMWRNTYINQQNRCERHAAFFAYEDMSHAKLFDKTSSGNYMSLEGIWKFSFSKDYGKHPLNFYKLDYDDSKWDDFKVPAIFEVNGYGKPIYKNTGYAWETTFNTNPPYISEINNYTGCYRKKVTIPAGWNGKSVFLYVGSATSNLMVWVNGKYVGYSEDSKVAAEFDITKYLKTGENTIAMQVMRWCDGSYCEGQDFWRLTGIAREVYLYARSKVHVKDFFVKADLTNDFKDGILSYTTDKSVNVSLVDADGKEVAKASGATGQISVGNVHPWTAETPYLYTLYVTNTNGGKTTEVIPFKVGFRHVEITNSQLCVNGQPILVKGVDRHEIDPDGGYVVSMERMLQDIKIMKRLNFNAVRTCHYSDDPRWYDLCDEYGLYVCAEANYESHGLGFDDHASVKDPRFLKTILEREEGNVKTLRNHPSVIIWSLGNESGLGDNSFKAYALVKKLDGTRPVQYERDRVSNHDATDIICPMYADPDSCLRALSKHYGKPLIQCEYAHAMGNSMGGFKDYWDIIRANREYQGGFIWDFVDQGLRDKSPLTGKEIFTYGGDYDEYPASDYNFNCNGLIAPDRRLNPHAYEVGYIQQSIWVTPVNLQKGEFKVFNEYFFKNIDDITCMIDICTNGKVVKTISNIDIKGIAPQMEKLIVSDEVKSAIADISDSSNGAEITVNFSFMNKDAKLLVDKGQVIARQQFFVKDYDFAATTNVEASNVNNVSLEETTSYLRFKASDVTISIGKNTGLIDYMYVKDEPVLRFRESLTPDFWRAPTDNDYGAQMQNKFAVWKDPARKLLKVECTKQNDGYTVKASFEMTDVKSELMMTYGIKNDGTVVVNEKLTPKSDAKDIPDMFRFGIQLQMPAAFSKVKYYGRGPEENYIDRNNSSFVGYYESDVKNEYFAYIRPQESGNHTDCRYFAIVNPATGNGLKFCGIAPMECSSTPYATSDIDDGPAKVHKWGHHSGDLVDKGVTQVHVSQNQYGIGCINSWWAMPLEKYRLHYGAKEFTFVIKAIVKNEF